MLSRSMPKRVLESMADGTRSKSDDYNPKRARIGDFSGMGIPCHSTNLGIIHDAMDIEDDGLRNRFLPYPQDNRFLTPHAHGLKLRAQDSNQSYVPQPRGFERDDWRNPHPSATSAGVCFGMLRDIKIRIDPVENPQTLHFNLLQDDNGIFACLDLSIENNRCDILCQDTYIATMNTETHFALSSIRLEEQPTWTGVIPVQELRDKMTDANTAPKGPSKVTCTTCTMGILVSGPRSIAQDLAKQLARQHLFLQNPVPVPANLEYDNPQWLYMVGTPCPHRAILPPLLETESQREIPTADVSKDEEEECENVRAVLDNLPHLELRRDIEIDSRIRATLESHQREAVDFIISREQPHSSNRGKLWRLESWNKGNNIYKHVITGKLSSEPEDFRGGLVADDMGVGKTLSMIASIVAGLQGGRMISADDEPNTKAGNPWSNAVISTLVIVPTVLLMDGWIAEVEKHVIPGALKCYKYHGSGRSISLSPPPDIILSTYATVEADFSTKGQESVLYKIHWHRVVLDEAHAVRNSKTKQFQAVNNLSASIRWCMTGTPIQNSVKDLWPLVQFLRVPQLGNSKCFEKYMMAGFKGSQSYLSDDRNLKLFLAAICLRRTMSAVFPALGGILVYHDLTLSDEERKAYNKVLEICSTYLKTAVNKQVGKKRGNPVTMTAQSWLRVFCNMGLRSPFLGRIDVHSGGDEVFSMLQQSGQNVCSLCNMEILFLDPSDGSETRENLCTPTRVLKCEKCATQTSDDDQQPTAGDPQVSLTLALYEGMKDMQITTGQDARYSSKLAALLEDINKHIDEDKSIVFSCWKKSLDLVGQMFDEIGISFCRVDGDMSPKQRQAALEEFQQKTVIRVLLMTIGTGAEGLNNLSVASRIHILEPQWNPSVENQAIGRALRWGQGKNVFVVRYTIEESVEQTVQDRQRWKMGFSLKDCDVR